MPPAYEVLLLNTAIPQIQAAQSGDTYVVPRDIAINATAIISANSATDALRITQTGAGNAILVEDSANPDSTPFVVTAAGDVGIGTTLPAYPLHVVGNVNGAVTSGVTNSNAGTSSVARFIAISDAGNATFGMTSSGYTDISGASDALLLNANNASNGMAFALDGNVKMKLDTSGNLGLGVTPGDWNANNKVFQLVNNASLFSRSGFTGVAQNFRYDSADTGIFMSAGYATLYYQNAGKHIWAVSTTSWSGSGSNIAALSDAMTLDASGNLLVGATSSSSGITLERSGATSAEIKLNQTGAGGRDYRISSTGSGYGTAGQLIFYDVTASAERARITSGGYFKASNNGTYISSTGAYHEFRSDGTALTLQVSNTNASPQGVYVEYSSAAPNGTGNPFFYCADNAALRAEIRSNGGLANYQANDVNLSDQRTKKDIVAAPSYWDKIKGIEIVHFKYKDQTHDDNNVGVIAQQVEQVAPEFVDQDGWGETPEDGVPLKSIYTSDMYHAAIKALQEAMARIETLEAEVAALKGA